MSAPLKSVQVRNGGLYLSASLCDHCFSGLETVALMRRDDDLLVFAVRHRGAGGYLLKRRNSAGDRVVLAPDFFREHGMDDDVERECAAHWISTDAILMIPQVFVN
ncbi:MAG: hypothetical protein P8Z80_04670 [Pseudolabrys sp.]